MWEQGYDTVKTDERQDSGGVGPEVGALACHLQQPNPAKGFLSLKVFPLLNNGLPNIYGTG